MFSSKNPVIDQSIIAKHLENLSLLLDKAHNLAIDSRKVMMGDIFCAYPGTLSDGRLFIDSALANGATNILFEPPSASKLAIEAYSYPVPHLMHLVGIFAAHKYGYSSRDLLNFAVTGTNGKTSISHWLNQAYNFLGIKTAIIGTTGVGVYPTLSDYAITTPDPINLQQLFREFKQQAVRVVAMEVSSHALDQGRVNGIFFTTAIFTNLTQDHLDYHKTMENYFLAKEQLFYWDNLKHAIINSDDQYGTRLLENLKRDNPRLNILTYGIESGDLRAKNIKLSRSGCQFTLVFNSQELELHTSLIGRFNVYNLLAVTASLLVNNINWQFLGEIIPHLKPVSGRMETIIIPNKPLVVVDYSHTPDSLEKALTTLNEIKDNGKLICVFGCGGNRDRAKRPLMGKIASTIADFVIVTSDNPRDEEPLAIIEEILPAMSTSINSTHSKYVVEEKRKEAISLAIKEANPNDVVLIAGKGHEDYQEIKGIKYPFNDLKLVRELILD